MSGTSSRDRAGGKISACAGGVRRQKIDSPKGPIANAKERPLPRRRVMNAIAFGVIVALCYSIALVPSLRRAHWDTSVFIDAGDRFVDSSKLDAPIIVRKHSDGYDGQFYYRLAVEPWPSASAAHGVTFDAAPWRAQRILCPVLAWASAS
jgi:hypothetical protein